ncbi:transglutaminase domain-containing protein [Zhouia amylolytica]|uniref:Transglutaminase-like domain-containing protein n=1 Tax=Zhouia amylolytica AD3 TaxID=1286632 RepID=W2UNV8_9FLAO|nr:tetratricopeptide repeat protein [Zhouia amylolytica]ETN95835.1 hypothetical protein P278_15570 [Zhouia amylolytica AD3]
MKKSISYLLFFLFISLSLHAQVKPNKFWDAILQNNRDQAEKHINSLGKSDIEKALQKQLLSIEKGNILPENTFYKAIAKYDLEELEYYLYALWNQPYFFDNYLEQGFSKYNANAVLTLSKLNFPAGTVKEALKYLNAIIHRNNNEWEAYYASNNSVNAIRGWQYCGVFENLNQSGHEVVYPPESIAHTTTDFNANSNGFINWYDAKTDPREAYQFFINHNEYGAGVSYAQTFITSNETKRVTLRLGSGSSYKVWVNDVLLLENNKDVQREMDDAQVAFELPSGTNRLLIKLSESNDQTYFIARLTDTSGNPVSGITSAPAYKEYNRSTQSSLEAKVLPNKYHAFFENKLAEDPNNMFYAFCLANAYLRVSKYEDAKRVIKPFIEAYPRSSFLRKTLINCYTIEGDASSVNKIKENLDKDDPNYYLPLLFKFTDQGELTRMDVNELEDFLVRFQNSCKSPIIAKTAEFMLNAKRLDKSAMKKNLDDLLEITKDRISLRVTFAPAYEQVFNDKERAIGILEEVNRNYFDYSALLSLSNYYQKENKKDKALQLFEDKYEYFKTDNTIISDYVARLLKYEMYKEAIPYLERSLYNFPYAFTAMEELGDAYLQLGKKEEAIKWFQKSLSHNSSSAALRTKINNIKKVGDPINDLVSEGVYELLAEERNKISENHYGYNILLDEVAVHLFEEGGGKYRFRMAYEITGQNGIDTFKEYNIGLTGSFTVHNSEIVKKDGSLVPADRSGANLVFEGLGIGDVVYIDCEYIFSEYGRFYKDFIDTFQIDASHPVVKQSYKILVPNSISLGYKVVNGSLKEHTKKYGDYKLIEWTLENNESKPREESYMPPSSDVYRTLHLSTVKDWSVIANWYSDLVRSTMEINDVVSQTFKEIFPNGYKGLTEKERAERIYAYMTANLNYSHVSFRQSGYVPQTPSKTLKTKLGDCKDFSSLFVTLGEMAELESIMVLILTSDYGKRAMVLPNKNFNHCIVKVKFDGAYQYLELTDKNLPFQALPNSLICASALDIPRKSEAGKESELYNLGDVKRAATVFYNAADIKITEDQKTYDITTKVSGSLKSSYADLFASNGDEILKQQIQSDFKKRMGIDLVLNEITNVQNESKSASLSFDSNITVNETDNKIGEVKIFKLPTLANAYTTSIVDEKERQYPIDYIQYENTDEYITEYHISLPQGGQFVEIPQNKSFQFQDHRFNITYKQISDAVLEVKMVAKVDRKEIATDDYLAFKEYVKGILEAKETFIGYKLKL